MSWCRFALGLVVGLVALPTAGRAILIEAGGGRVGGYFVRDDGAKLVIRVLTADGKDKISEYDRAKIKFKIIHQLDRKRLEALSRDNPKAYRDYAEELAGQDADPEARATAMRLFLIAAYLDPKQFGNSSLLGMSQLASTPAEARRCRAMAFLLDPRADAGVLKTEGRKPNQLPKGQAGALVDFLTALQDFRAGQIQAARVAVAREGVDRISSLAPGMLDKKAFLQLCTDATCETCAGKKKVPCAGCNGKGTIVGTFGRPQRCPVCNGQKSATCPDCDGTGVNHTIPDDVLRRVLRAELWAVERLSGSEGHAKKGTGKKSWSSVLQDRQLTPVAPLSLETITDIDPRKCLYRNGTWVAP
jgi:hypothetical protein